MVTMDARIRSYEQSWGAQSPSNWNSEYEIANNADIVRMLSSNTRLTLHIVVVHDGTVTSELCRQRWDFLLSVFRVPGNIKLEVSHRKPQSLFHKTYNIPHWLFACSCSTYVNLSELFQRLLTRLGHPEDALVFGLSDLNMLDAGVLFSEPVVRALHSSGNCERFSAACLSKLNFTVTPLQGLHPLNSTTIFEMMFTTLFFNSSVYARLPGGAHSAIARTHITYGNFFANTSMFYDLAYADAHQSKVPKILHHIWLGDTDVTADVAASAAECKKMHESRGWRYILWTEADLVREGIPGNFLIAAARANFHLVADVLRLLLLYIYGGVYTDIDAVCVQPFDPVLAYAAKKSVDMVVARESDRHCGALIANGVIVASPASRTLTALIAEVAVRISSGPTTGYTQFTAWQTSGPSLFTHVFAHHASQVNGFVLSSDAFYPVHYNDMNIMPLSTTDLLDIARFKGSYTIQLWRGTTKNIPAS